MIDKVDNALCRIEEWFLIISVALMGLIMTAQIFCRLFFTALTWSEETAKYIFVWAVFVGLGYGIAKGVHIEMDFLIQKFSDKAKLILKIIVDFLCIIILIYLFMPSIDYTKFQATQNAATIPIHMGYVAAAMPVSIILTCASLILDIIKRGKESGTWRHS